MIRYALNCKNGHQFESWFQSAEAYDKLLAAGMVSCSVCGGTDVVKGLMAPRLSTSDTPEPTAPALTEETSPAEQALAEMRKKIEESSDYVGADFATEARAMHLGDSPNRSIYGEAKVEEAKELLEDGIPVVPLPFTPSRKNN
ncbi:DUF1178 family protein [Actibacterium pelagium]|uniref:DUF1178 family protein n=1 Tax=Actibacterium pelagium TaxID=2029103 RepID=A0A917EKP1_9RHOB|nr:DUF1178 family protein [Actibacterium pelagium]GGE57746.1 hypothetical protein GCM10011517_26930 [Actibacterium pelagium]